MQTILAIDDAAEIHVLLDARLKHESVIVHHALSAEDGLEKARTLAPDLVLLDLDMPDVTGFEICKILKADPRTAAVPVIFLTATSSVFVKVEGFDLGAVDYVTKPFEPAELRARVRAALRTKRYQDMLAMHAHIDGMTGLWNRNYYNFRIEEELAASRRCGREVCLVVIDVDHFKEFNDQYGHPFGDRVLQRLGEVLASSVRTTDAACRFGGDEFAVILSDTSSQAGAVIAQRMQESIGSLSFREGANVVTVSATIGVAGTDCLIEPTAEGLLAAADAALYEGKRAGRDRLHRASPLDRCIRRIG